MFKRLYGECRASTLFEKLLLLVGIAIGVIGFWFINTIFSQNPIFSYEFLMVIFLWLLLIFIVILTASNESIKEELAVIIKEHIDETRLLRQEFKVLNKNLSKKK